MPFPRRRGAEEFRSRIRRMAFVMRAVACSVLCALALIVACVVVIWIS
jgi:hypothetical protein